MSKTFGKIFGTPSSSSQSQSSASQTGFNALPQQAQNQWLQGLTQAGSLASNPSLFQNAPTNALQNQAANYFSTPVQGITGDQFNQGINTFSNPFENDVINYANADINRQQALDLSNIGSFANNIGGFGSNRRGLLESELQRNTLNTIGQTDAGLRQSNFNNAATNTLNQFNTTQAMNQQNMNNLYNIGTQQQQQATQNQQAPIQALNYLFGALQGLPASGNSSSGGSGVTTGAYGGIGLPGVQAIGNGIGAGIGALGALL